MSSARRIPFVLNLDDPLDAAIWDALEPMLDRRRASAFIRTAVAQSLGLVATAAYTGDAPSSALPAISSDLAIAKRPKRGKASDKTASRSNSSEEDADSLDAAANNFLNAFG